MNLGKHGLLLIVGGGGSSVSWSLVVTVNPVAICAAWRRPETSEMDVFTLQLITMSDAASLDVWGGEMPAKCSHHDLMRWFSCSSAPSALLCNSEAPTQQFHWPACVTSAFVWRSPCCPQTPWNMLNGCCGRTGVQRAVNQCGVCGLIMGRKRRGGTVYGEKGITVRPTHTHTHTHTHTVRISATYRRHGEPAFLLLSVLVARQCCSWQCPRAEAPLSDNG